MPLDPNSADRLGHVEIQGDPLAQVAGVVALGDMMTHQPATDDQIRRALTLYELDTDDANVATVRTYLSQ